MSFIEGDSSEDRPIHVHEVTEQLSRLLDTHFCDAPNTEEHGFFLKKFAEEYLEQYEFRKIAQVFNALADENRLKILSLLAFREMCVCELTAALGMTQPNLTYHIKKLENAGLVKYDKRGKWVYYSLSDDSLRKFNLEGIVNKSITGGE